MWSRSLRECLFPDLPSEPVLLRSDLSLDPLPSRPLPPPLLEDLWLRSPPFFLSRSEGLLRRLRSRLCPSRPRLRLLLEELEELPLELLRELEPELEPLDEELLPLEDEELELLEDEELELPPRLLLLLALSLSRALGRPRSASGCPSALASFGVSLAAGGTTEGCSCVDG